MLRPPHISTPLLMLVLAQNLSGCSFLSSLFPDKQKQYQYSTEIPPLEIPPDLMASTIQGARQQHAPGTTGSLPSAQESLNALTDTPPQSPSIDTATSASPEPELRASSSRGRDDTADETDSTNDVGSGHAVLAEGSDGTPLIELDENYPSAWNSVGRALGRLKLEISDQNRTDGLYYVYFGEPDQPEDDHGLLSSLAAFLSGKSSKNGKEYHVKVEERGKITYVLVLNDKNQPQSEGDGLKLLKSLHKTLQNLSGHPADDEENP